MPRIENWSFVFKGDDAYMPPELSKQALHGEVYGHHRCEDGKSVLTSSVVHADGRKITTSSGTVYELGKPHEEYSRWCEERGRPIDPDNPFPRQEDIQDSFREPVESLDENHEFLTIN